jgi:signal peptidase II
MTDTPEPEASVTRPRVSGWRRRVHPLSLAVAALLLLVDEGSKSWAVSRLSNGRTVHVLGSLQFNLSYNSGMAFGRGKGLGPVIGVVALVVVVYLLIGLRTEGSTLSSIAVGMVMGGASGNVCDRLFRGSGWFRGSVVDFIDLRWWPVFNVADIGVTLGGLLLVVGSLWLRSAKTA